MRKVYFPGLNGVRFIAALLVIIDHTELFKSNFGYGTLWEDPYSSFLGASGVTIFFVLSGFLITFLLISEKQEGGVHIKNFYIRRILRIWPLYYLVLLVGFFIVPHLGFLDVPNYTTDMQEYGTRFILFFTLFANVAYVYLPTVAYSNILWSVAVEEQFYLFWPHIVKHSRKLLYVMLAFIVLFVALRLALMVTLPQSRINALVERTRFTSMVIGALGAYVVVHKHNVLNFIYDRSVQGVTILTFILLLADVIHSKYTDLFLWEILSVVVCCLIVNIATNDRSFIKLETNWLNYLGKLSYGLYVYHLFAVVITLKVIPVVFNIGSLNAPLGYSLTMISILGLTTIMSHISYTYFEGLFLRKKMSYSSIISGDLVKRAT